MKNILILIAIIFNSLNLLSQFNSLYVPKNMKEAYDKKSRDKSGKPGISYWQNKPSYTMNIEFDPANSAIYGNETIKYQNNSPDTLKELTLTVLADIYNKNNYQHDWEMNRKFMNEGMIFEKIEVGGTQLDLKGMNFSRYATNAFIKLEKPLLPKTSIDIAIKWKFYHPDSLMVREGNYGDSTFMMGYFYPKLAVYDDIDGWDKHIYTGFGEFNGEIADYDVKITLPGKFKVWATGLLQNPEKVLSPEYLKRYNEALKVGKTIKIIDKNEVNSNDITLKADKLMWHFKASDVPDFAFGTSDKFRWDAKTIVVDKSTGRTSFLCTAYGADRKNYPMVIDLLDTILTNFSNRVPGVPYPYPSMKIFNGNAGMEFPMMCNNAEEDDRKGTVYLNYHEVGHTYFPFMEGINERKYAWMDEGWATFFPYFYSSEHISDSVFNYFQSRVDNYIQIAGHDTEVPIFTLVDHLRTRAPYRQASYNKAFLAYYYLYDYLGETRFLKGLQGYMAKWQNKHPIPYDFFNSFNDLTEEDLNWFWKNWFMEPGYADMSISLSDNILNVENIGKLALPVKIKIVYKDGNSSTIGYNMKIWNSGSILKIPVSRPNEIKSITLGDDKIVDVDKSNNVLTFGVGK